MKKTLLIILLLGAILRLFALSAYPSGLNADEAALGYNAYSLLTTGKDEHGHPWPVNLESFGDYKPALYTYILIPFIKVLGLTEFAVRLPSALFGILSILFIYLFTQELLKIQKISLLAAFLLAISPWHLHFSRGAWETNVATSMILIGTWAFIKWIKNSKFMYLVILILGFAFSMYTYQSARLIAPLIGIGLVFLHRQVIFSRPKHLLLGCLVLVLTLIPLGLSLTGSNTASRISGVGIFADIGPINRINELRGHYTNPQALLPRLLHNKVIIYSLLFVKNYTDHFDPTFLFISGDEVQRSRIPETGQLYLTEIIFLSFGFFYLLRLGSSSPKIIWLWLIIAPLASALTFQTPSALRSHLLVIPLTIISACGIVYLFQKISSYRKLTHLLLLLTVTIYCWQLARYLHQYYIHYPKTYPAAWEYGFKELVPYIEANKSRYDQVLITDKYDQPYILFLFYSKYPPGDFQFHHQLTFRDKFNFSTVRAYDTYKFTSTPWDKVRDLHSSLIVAAPEDIPPVGVNIVKTINFPNGQPAFKVISN